MHPISSRSFKYGILKQANVGVTISWGFLFTYVTIRTLGRELFSFLAILNSFGILLAFIDFGVAKVAFLELAFQNGELGLSKFFRTSLLSLYAVIILCGSLIAFGIVLLLAHSLTWAVYAVLFFPTCAFGLAWNLVNNLGLAAEKYINVELLDITRKTYQIVALSTLFLHWPLTFVLLLFLLGWLVALSTAGFVLRLAIPGSVDDFRVGLADIKTFVNARLSSLSHSIVFIMTEMIIYQTPVFVVPAMVGLGTPVVIIDNFYKFHRAAAAGLRAIADGRTPLLVNAFRAKGRAHVRKVVFTTLTFSVLLAGVISFSLVMIGPTIIRIIVGGKLRIAWVIIPPVLTFISANAIQNVAQNFLLNTGGLQTLRNAGLIYVALVVCAFALGMALKLDEATLLLTYSISFLLGALNLARGAWAWSCQVKDVAYSSGRTISLESRSLMR